MIKYFLAFVLLVLSTITDAKEPQFDSVNTIYNVVVNHEEQYSIWPKELQVPKGWKAIGKSGTKKQCLEYIDEVWTDMRPLSLSIYKKLKAKAKK